MGGFSYNQWNASGITVQNAPTIAGSLIYDFWKWGASRPFLEAGGALTPYEDVHYSRSYAMADDGGRLRLGDQPRPLPVRTGGMDRAPHADRRGVGLRRSQPQLDADRRLHRSHDRAQPLSRDGRERPRPPQRGALGAQITHLFNGNIEANLSGAVAYGFGAGSEPRSMSTTSARSRRTRCRTRPGPSTARASAIASTIVW